MLLNLPCWDVHALWEMFAGNIELHSFSVIRDLFNLCIGFFIVIIRGLVEAFLFVCFYLFLFYSLGWLYGG